MKHSYKILVGIPEGKKLLRRSSCVWNDNINVAVKEMGYRVVGWTYLAQRRVQWYQRLTC
jgi:hypothetical protein